MAEKPGKIKMQRAGRVRWFQAHMVELVKSRGWEVAPGVPNEAKQIAELAQNKPAPEKTAPEAPEKKGKAPDPDPNGDVELGGSLKYTQKRSAELLAFVKTLPLEQVEVFFKGDDRAFAMKVKAEVYGKAKG